MKLKKNLFKIINYGCQMNKNDSEILAGMLLERGYAPAEEMNQADLIILNTCSVRASAENKVYGKIGEIKHLKSSRPGLILAVCGCMVQKDMEYLKKHYPHIDILFGTHNIHEFPELLEQVEKTHQKALAVWEKGSKAIVEGLPVQREGNGVSAYVSIIYGCTNFCSYCIVPYVRGPEKSRQLKDIINEIEQLAGEGYQEITLLGQNVNAYGKDLPEEVDFVDLLEAVNRIPGIKRIRYTSPHPRDMTKAVVDAVKRLDKVCEHFHLPVQYGDDEILREMNRGYTVRDFKELISYIRLVLPEASITTDVIVGFPGESDENFKNLLDFFAEVRFDMAHTLIYSPRPGTRAAKMPNQVPEEIKKARLKELMNLQEKIAYEINQKLEGQEVELLIEGPSEKDPAKLCGRTRTNKVVIVEGSSDLIGKLVKVKITEAKSWLIVGEIL